MIRSLGVARRRRETMEINNRANFVDFGRFFFAFCIVAIHSGLSRDFPNSDLLPYLLAIAVPFFFICSGYFLSLKLIKFQDDLAGYRDTIKKYFMRLAIPYCVWGSWYFSISIFKALGAKEPSEEIVFCLKAWFFSSPGGGLWYVQTILALLVIMWFIGNRKRYLRILTLILLASFCFAFSRLEAPIQARR